MIYLNENGGRQEIWIPLKGKANGYNGTTAPLYEEITENGEYVWDRSNGFSPVTVKVDVAGGGKVDVGALGIKLQGSSFAEVPDAFDFSNCTSMENMFYNCYNLTTVPAINTSKVTQMGSTFFNCTKLTTVSRMNTSKVTRMRYMFFNCSALATIPQLDTSNVKDMGDMFYNCRNLTTIPAIDTSSATYMGRMFYYCAKLTTIPQLDMSNCTNLEDIFIACRALTSLTLVGSLNADLELKHSPLNEDSIKSVLTAASKTTNTTAKTLTFNTGSTLKDSDGVWAALISECTGKGWTIQNLTLA